MKVQKNKNNWKRPDGKDYNGDTEPHRIDIINEASHTPSE